MKNQNECAEGGAKDAGEEGAGNTEDGNSEEVAEYLRREEMCEGIESGL